MGPRRARGGLAEIALWPPLCRSRDRGAACPDRRRNDTHLRDPPPIGATLRHACDYHATFVRGPMGLGAWTRGRHGADSYGGSTAWNLGRGGLWRIVPATADRERAANRVQRLHRRDGDLVRR